MRRKERSMACVHLLLPVVVAVAFVSACAPGARRVVPSPRDGSIDDTSFRQRIGGACPMNDDGDNFIVYIGNQNGRCESPDICIATRGHENGYCTRPCQNDLDCTMNIEGCSNPAVCRPVMIFGEFACCKMCVCPSSAMEDEYKFITEECKGKKPSCG